MYCEFKWWIESPNSNLWTADSEEGCQIYYQGERIAQCEADKVASRIM